MFFLAITLFFVSFALLGYVVVRLVLPADTVLKQQLRFYDESWLKAHVSAGSNEKSGPKDRDLTFGLAAKMGVTAFIRTQLARSGVDVEVGDFIFFHLVAVAFMGLIGYIAKGWFGLAVAAFTFAFLPVSILLRLEAKRKALFHAQLPETLLLVAGSLKAGHSFLQAVDMIVKETTPPMSTEFKRVLAEARLGLPVETGLEKMAARVNSPDFSWVVMAVKIQREVGGNLAEVLEILAATVRERDQVSRQIRVLTAEGRLSAIILFALPIVLSVVLFLINPGYMSLLYSNLFGVGMVAVSVCLMIAGGLWLRHIIKIEV